MWRNRARRPSQRHLTVCRGRGDADERSFGGIIGHERHRLPTHRQCEVCHPCLIDLQSAPGRVEGSRWSGRDDILRREDLELKAALRTGLGTNASPRLFGRQASTNPCVRHGLAPVVHHLAFQQHPGLQGNVEDGILRDCYSLYRLVQEVVMIHINLVSPSRHSQAVVAGLICRDRKPTS